MQLPTPKIPRRLIPAPEDYLQQRIQSRYNYPIFRASNRYGRHANDGPQAIEVALLKYYPKYCRSLRFDDNKKSWPVLSRVKQIKTLENFLYDSEWDHCSTEQCIKKKMKPLFKNKRKSVKSLPIINSGQKGPFQRRNVRVLMSLCPYFPKIQTLKVFPPESFHPHRKKNETSREFDKKIIKSYGYFWCSLNSIRHLEITTSAPRFWIILPELRSSKSFLSFLKSFCLEVEPLDVYTHNAHGGIKCAPKFVFQALLQNQDLLKYVTHLKFSRNFKNFHLYGPQVKSILDCCPNLISVSFPIDTELSLTDRLFGSKTHLTLAPLQSLRNVTVLTLTVEHIWSFIEVFEFPLFLQRLTLHLYFRDSLRNVWKDLNIKKSEKRQVLLNFFEKFKRLANLTSLDLNMPLFTQPSELMNKFILPLLQAIPKLENFECQLYRDSQISAHLDMSIFLDGLAPLHQLKSLKIFQRLHGSKTMKSHDLIMTFDPMKSYSFPNLTSVYIDTWIHEDFNFKKFFKIFPKGLKEITLTKIHVSSIDSFIRLLRFFSNFYALPSAKINLTIILCLDNFEDLRNLRHYLFIPAENVFITTSIYISSPNLHYLGPKEMQIIQDALGSLKVNITASGKYHKDIPIMRNNIPYDATLAHNSSNYDTES